MVDQHMMPWDRLSWPEPTTEAELNAQMALRIFLLGWSQSPNDRDFDRLWRFTKVVIQILWTAQQLPGTWEDDLE
ncbi:hypothetical protein PaG_00657 [Moesziomyces aphidis]|uniref:Uncharacterized protein n=1 Tax=Moesziomyces aphidis TaxID=84754 RepID=W3VV93_MOEAP|nr:hypothetical protein PaG_00657 [Moesziomyces aphidis]